MNRISKNIACVLVFIALTVTSPVALAGTYSASFLNDFQTDSIYLFLSDNNPSHDVIFQSVSFSNASWGVADQNDTYLRLTGPAADPRDVRFNITFTDSRRARNILPFTLEWAEYLNGGPSAIDAMGSITLDRNGRRYNWIASNDFNSVIPNPIPASTWLLLSGICFLVGIRRHNQR